jgi:hypothetical protein
MFEQFAHKRRQSRQSTRQAQLQSFLKRERVRQLEPRGNIRLPAPTWILTRNSFAQSILRLRASFLPLVVQQAEW